MRLATQWNTGCKHPVLTPPLEIYLAVSGWRGSALGSTPGTSVCQLYCWSTWDIRNPRNLFIVFLNLPIELNLY